MKLEDVDEARASWMKLEMVCIQLCQGAVSAWCTDKPYIVDSVPDHMVVVAYQEHVIFIPVVVSEPWHLCNVGVLTTHTNNLYNNRTVRVFNSACIIFFFACRSSWLEEGCTRMKSCCPLCF